MSKWVVVESVDGIVTGITSFVDEPSARLWLERKKLSYATDFNIDSIGYHYSTEKKRGFQLWVL